MPRAIISSGHTSKDPGSQANGLIEYEVARKISRAVLPFLRQHGIITLSVPADLDLLNRIDWINKTSYDETTNDIAVEIHINEGGKRGIETWYEGEGESKSKQLSDILLKTTSEESGLPKQSSNSEYNHEIGSIAFLHDCNAITALIECGYIDNEEDAKFLKVDTNITKIAKGIAKGVLEYFGIEFKEFPAAATQPITSPATPTSQIPTQPVTAPVAGNSFGGINNFNTPPYNPQSNFGSDMGGFGGPPPVAQGGFMNRDDRKKMVETMYVKVLGREPNQNDLNYFLNIGINENELLKKMVDSQEHADLVKSRQEVIKAKDEMNENKAELIQLRASVEDQKVIIRNLHALIAQKNQAIAQAQQQLGMMQNYQNSQNQASAQQQASQSNHNYKGTFLDKLFKAFSDLFE